MKLPAMNAEQSLDAAGSPYRGAAERTVYPGVYPEGFFGDVWKGIKKVGKTIGNVVTKQGPCIAKCGAQALPCVSCGKDVGCWAKCAGPGVVSCVSKCF